MDEFIRDKVIEKTSSSKLRQRLLMEGSELTLQKTLTLSATTESSEREARAMEKTSAPGGASAVPVHSVQQSTSKHERRFCIRTFCNTNF